MKKASTNEKLNASTHRSRKHSPPELIDPKPTQEHQVDVCKHNKTSFDEDPPLTTEPQTATDNRARTVLALGGTAVAPESELPLSFRCSNFEFTISCCCF